MHTSTLQTPKIILVLVKSCKSKAIIIKFIVSQEIISITLCTRALFINIKYLFVTFSTMKSFTENAIIADSKKLKEVENLKRS